MGFPQLRTQKPFRFREPTAYILTADAGSYTCTGTDQTLRATRKLDTFTTPGSYAISGTDVTLAGGKILVASGGSYTYTGTDADLAAEVIPPTLSYNEIRRVNYPRAFHPSLRKPMRFARPLISNTIAADGDSYTYTGTNATLVVAYKLVAGAGSYAVSGTDATLNNVEAPQQLLSTTQLKRYNYPRAFHPSLRKPIRFAVTATQDYILAANPGSYAVGGEAATLTASSDVQILRRRPKKPNTWPRQFAPTEFGQLRSEKLRRRQAIGLNPSQAFFLIASAGSYAVSAGTTVIIAGRKVVPAAGTYAITGTDAILTKGLLPALAGSYALTGTAASLEHSHVLIAGAGSYVLTGTDASIERAYHIDSEAGVYTYTGEDTGENQPISRALVADSGTYTLTGTAITVITDATIPLGTTIEGNVFIETGFEAAVTIATVLTSDVNI